MNEEYENENDDFIDTDESDDFIDGIEIDDDIDILEDDDPIDSNLELSKHTVNEKHSLVHDSIFKGKKEKPLDEYALEGVHMYFNDTFEVDKSSNYYTESIDNESYVRNKLVREKIYEVLKEKTKLDFSMNRRKPSKADFNNYFYLIKTSLREESFTNIELFNELAVYFSDNLFNMFKLLDDRWRNAMIIELKEHIGRQNYSKEILNRNIYVDTEIEFIILSSDNTPRYITGVVTETHYAESSFTVDSYENMYQVDIGAITKILNNTKFKTNLDKLNNIDFL